VVADKLTIRSADSHLTNNDGIDIDSCQARWFPIAILKAATMRFA